MSQPSNDYSGQPTKKLGELPGRTIAVFNFLIFNFGHSNLFRVSDFEFLTTILVSLPSVRLCNVRPLMEK